MIRSVVILLCCLVSHAAFAVEVKEVVSQRGIKAWLVEEHALPLIAAKIVFTDSGYTHDAKGKEGRANMTAAMLTEGAGDMDSRAFNEAIESHAIDIGVGVDEDMFRLSLQTLSEHKETAFSYLGMMLRDPRFDADAMERTRRQTLSILMQQNQEPGYLLWKHWQKAAFPNHPYSNPPAGTAESVAELSKDDLRFYLSHYLTQKNMVIAVVGDITPDALARLLDDHLGSLPTAFEPDVKVEDIIVAPGSKPQAIDFDIPQSMVMFGLPSLKRSDPAYFDAYVMNYILGSGSLTARLGEELREKRGLTYAVGSYLDPMQHSNAWRGSFSTRNDQAKAALDVLKGTLETFVKEGPTDTEIADAKRYITGSFVLSLGSNSDIANFLINMQVDDLGMDYLNRRNSLVEAVSKEKVVAMSKRLIEADKLQISVIGKPNLAESKP